MTDKATGPPSARRTPAASLTMRVSARARALLSSLSLPPRMTIVVSGEPAPESAAWKPSAIKSTATKTRTTPATPTTATVEAPARCRSVRSESVVMTMVRLSPPIPHLPSPSTIRSRVACSPGQAAEVAPEAMTRPAPMARPRGRDSELRQEAARRVAPAEDPGEQPRGRPSRPRPPAARLEQDQGRTRPFVKPSVFSTASSLVRSRIACAIVLVVISSSVKNTAPRMATSIASTFPS